MKRGDINRSIQDCLFGSEGGCLGAEIFSAKNIWLVDVVAILFQRINWGEMPPGGLEGRHSSGAVLLPAAALTGLPLPGPASKASQEKKPNSFFHLLQRVS